MTISDYIILDKPIFLDKYLNNNPGQTTGMAPGAGDMQYRGAVASLSGVKRSITSNWTEGRAECIRDAGVMYDKPTCRRHTTYVKIGISVDVSVVWRWREGSS